MMEIKDSKLYLLEYKTFEDFAYKEYGFKKTKAWRIAASFKALDTKPPAPESGVKLPNLTPDKEPGGEFKMDTPTPEPEQKQPEILVYNLKRSGKPDVSVDQQIEGEMAEFFLKNDDMVKPWADALKDLKAMILADIKDNPTWAGFNVSHFEKYIGNIKEMIKFNRPWAQCPVCSGDGGVKGGCKTCKDPSPVDPKDPKRKTGRGWLIHNQWRCIPEDEK